MTQDHMHLAFSVHLSGAHQGAWHDGATRERAYVRVDSFREIAQIAERGFFDTVFVADSPAVRTEPRDAYSRIQHIAHELVDVSASSDIYAAS